MADIIELAKYVDPKKYSLDVTQYPDNLLFTVNGIKINPEALRQVADNLEKIARIIRTDVVIGAI